MGQAKNRGTVEQRIAESLGLKQRSLADIKKECGLPDDAVFLGYGVHLVARDEFLAAIEDSAAATKKIWTKNPEGALKTDGFSEAYQNAKKCRGAIVVGMFDLGKQIYVAQVGT